MTMQTSPHPDDELLAAYAGGDADALADGVLRAHLSTCDRCRPIVDELSLLHMALAELPDLAPSRPLRLIPPAPAAAVPAPSGSWLRRLTAPAMAAGAALALVGAVGIGASSSVGLLFSNVGENLQGGGATDQEGVPAPGVFSPTLVPGDTASGGGAYRASAVPRTPQSMQPATPRPSAKAVSEGDNGTSGRSSEQPWLTLLIAGAGLFGISGILRFSLVPRAG
jgi:hypothetical protein